MKVLITGSTGQLGFCLQQTKPNTIRHQAIECIALGREQADLSDPASILQQLNYHRPDIIVNAAAYTSVDKAESEPEKAKAINADAVKILVDWCDVNCALLVHVSTDFVFDGNEATAYQTSSLTNPLGIYGATKLQGEQHVLSSKANAHIVRTGWVYAEQGANFVKTMLRLANERDSLQIVADQIGTPTYARHLAQMIWQLIERNPSPSVWHFSDSGVASWYDFATAIFEEANQIGLINKSVDLKPIKTSEYPTPAKRPAFSVLDKERTWKELDISPIHWRVALRDMLGRLRELQKA